MNVSDYIVDFIGQHNVEHVFGYQGTMIAYFVDAVHRNKRVHNHSCYNEQGASFAACGYAQASGRCAVAYSTSGPGAVNLLSGIANSYFDSLPVLFITGQLNTYEYLNVKGLRQQGFQEIDIVSMAKPVTKYAVQIFDAQRVRYELEKAWYLANEGRAGAVLLDIPMNIQRTEIDPQLLEGFTPETAPADGGDRNSVDAAIAKLSSLLSQSKRPVLLLGNGVKEQSEKAVLDFACAHNIPIVTSLLGKRILPDEHKLNFGYYGAAYGKRISNLLTCAKADLLICIGISLCSRQIGTKPGTFAPNAKLFRVDIDNYALDRVVKQDEMSYLVSSVAFIDKLKTIDAADYTPWYEVANKCRSYLTDFDAQTQERYPNRLINNFSRLTYEDCAVAVDVGQHMMWAAQSFETKRGQRVLFSGGHGAMGYSLPAAIGAHYATGKTSYCIAGDGSFQMNIQELEWIVREKLPVKILIMNNHTLGMIRFLQTDYFDDRFEGTCESDNYHACNFMEIAQAYGINAVRITADDDIDSVADMMKDSSPLLIEVVLPETTCSYPKTFLGQPIYNQRPCIPEEKLEELISL